jgi:hypothetical protein
VLFAARDREQLEVRWNGIPLGTAERDPAWKDPQIFSPAPQPASGGSGHYRVNPSQRLLRIELPIDPRLCKVGENRVEVRLAGDSGGPPPDRIALEKLEVHLHYRPPNFP